MENKEYTQWAKNNKTKKSEEKPKFISTMKIGLASILVFIVSLVEFNEIVHYICTHSEGAGPQPIVG